jgi:hypothetical protein
MQKGAERMKETKVCNTDTLRVPVRARYTIDKKGGWMTRSFETAELTVKELAEFLARKFGLDLTENIITETGGDAV